MIDDNYDPGIAEKAAVAKINEEFDASKRYWNTKHQTQQRLYRRYLNDDVKGPRPAGLSDERTGMFYRCADILHSMISDALLVQCPVGKMRGTGQEDNEAREVIDRVNGYQQQSTDILNTLDQAILQAVITCGVIMPGWDHHSEIYWKDVLKTMVIADPNNNYLPGEIPTGEIERKPFSVDISRLDATLVEPWNVYPTSGATSPVNAHQIIFRVPLARQTLQAMENSGYLKNVAKIPESDYGRGAVSDGMIDDTPIFQARKEGDNPQDTKAEYAWIHFCYHLFPFFKYPENFGEIGYSEDEFECLTIKTEGSNTVLKFECNELSAKPCVVFRYAGDTFFGFSALEIAERLLQLDEDMFNWTMDRAKHEVYERIFVSEGINQSKVANPGVNSVITVPNTVSMIAGKAPVWTEPQNPHIMPNLAKQREIVYQLIEEVLMTLNMITGASDQTTSDESATMTNSKMQFVSKRFKNRLKYFERNGLWWWMQWQTILNCHFLKDEEVAAIADISPALNPFKIITPTLPIQTYDFAFEGSVKAIDDPVKAQILKDLLKTAMTIPPGIGSDGKLKQPNLTRLFEEILKHSNVTDDMDEFFIEPTPQQIAGPPAGNGGNTPLGAVTPQDVANGVPNAGAGIRQEQQ
jgi:hypothetical protein